MNLSLFTLKYLTDLRHQHDCSKTQMRWDYVPRRKYSDKTANSLTTCVIDWIKLNGGQAERVSNEGRIIDNRKIVTNVIGQQKMIGSITRIKGSGKRGTSDVHSTINGRSVKWEVKMKDKQSDHQRAYQAEIEAAGGKYFIVHDFKEFIEYYYSL